MLIHKYSSYNYFIYILELTFSSLVRSIALNKILVISISYKINKE